MARRRRPLCLILRSWREFMNHKARKIAAVLLFLLAVPLTGASQTPQPANANNEYQTGAILWTQTSGERMALSYQAFALARMMLDRDLRTVRSRARRAVIVDIDETIMDNSRFQAWLVKSHQTYNDQTWQAWVNRAEASAV